MQQRPVSADDSTIPANRFDRWLFARRVQVVLLIIVVGGLLRTAAFIELSAGPCVALTAWPQSDMNYFDGWARQIVEGDLLSRSVALPMHAPHRDIAAGYASAFPDQWAELSQDGALSDEDAARLLWDRWCGGGRFYQDPAYAYLVAATYALAGPRPVVVWLWQSVLGLGSIVLVYFIARRTFGDLAGVIAAGLLLLYAPLLFYEFVLLRTTLITFTGLLLVYGLQRACEAKWMGAWGIVGFALGWALTVKAQFLLMLFAAVCLMVVSVRRRPTALARAGGLLFVGVLIGFSPVLIRNVLVGAPWWATASGGATTFVAANAVGAGYGSWGLREAGRILGESDGRFIPAAIESIRSHGSALGYLELFADKLLMVWHGSETPNNTDFNFYQLQTRVLASLPISFGWIAATGLVGLALSLRLGSQSAALWSLVGTHLVVLLAFFVYARFRLPLAAALAPFAGLAAARVVVWVTTARWRPAFAAISATAVLSLWTLSPHPTGLPAVRATDLNVALEYYYSPRIGAALARGDPRAAAELLADLLRKPPACVIAVGPDHPIANSSATVVVASYARVYRAHARLLEQADMTEAAQDADRRAAQLESAVP